jgi:hypothetical protein
MIGLMIGALKIWNKIYLIENYKKGNIMDREIKKNETADICNIIGS